MNRAEAISEIDCVLFEQDHLNRKEVMKALKQPLTLAEFLGWEEGQEYEYRSVDILMLDNGKIYIKSDKCSSGWCNYAFFGSELEDLRQAKKVEKPKLKAWHVKDEYSFNCLMKELGNRFVFIHSKENYICEKDDGDGRKYYQWTKDFEEIKDTHEVIEYHKEEPRYLLQTDLTSENGVQYLSFDKKRREYFLGALISSDNVQQSFTDDEIIKIKTMTRFAKLCEKVEVE